eukprot:GHVS01040845.1.p1 GENE.GHVS01040845.1~~GHVS01040845.1.p1  ORF type:complete len:142 (+),score=31.06 GHVS01040845.1:890-1315(+)
MSSSRASVSYTAYRLASSYFGPSSTRRNYVRCVGRLVAAHFPSSSFRLNSSTLRLEDAAFLGGSSAATATAAELVASAGTVGVLLSAAGGRLASCLGGGGGGLASAANSRGGSGDILAVRNASDSFLGWHPQTTLNMSYLA